MGLFDYIRCDMPLSGQRDARLWQTKDTSGFPQMDLYEIRPDGTLWHQGYDVEDHSDPSAEGLMRLAGMMTRVNQRWGRVEHFTGEIRFYGFKDDESSLGWLEYSAYFIDGHLKELHCVVDQDADGSESPQAADAVDPSAGNQER